MLEVDSTGSSQGGLKCAGPLLVGPGETEYLVRGKAKITEHRSERPAAVDRVEKLLPHTRRGVAACALRRPRALAASFCARRHWSQSQPSGPPDQCAVGDLRAAAATLGIGLVTDLMQLLESPRRLRDQAERAPASDDRRRHIAHGSRLANRCDHLLSIHQTNASGSALALA